MRAVSHRLRGGELRLRIDSASWPPEQLFRLASRRNPRRAFLFVSTVLGRHIPVAPSQMRRAFTALAGQVPADLPGPVLVFGMAETAVGLGAGVHQCLAAGRDDCLYLCSSRHATGGPLLTRFVEAHSHASDHLVHEPQAAADRQLMLEARSLVLVDDEASTGNTAVNLVEALRAAGLDRLERIVLATLTDFSANAAADRLALPCTQVSLLAGQWEWEADPAAELPAMPRVDSVARGSWQCRPAQDWGRLGCRASADPLAGAVSPEPGRRTLVLGSSEYVWPPFRLAEALEVGGEQVRFSATTRSPIALGEAITRREQFADNYGLGIPNYLYNVDPDAYDRILLCVETRAEAVDPALVARLGAEIITEPGA